MSCQTTLVYLIYPMGLTSVVGDLANPSMGRGTGQKYRT